MPSKYKIYTPYKYFEYLINSTPTVPTPSGWNDVKRGKAVCDFIEQNCVLTSARWFGKPFILTEWQRMIIEVFYGFQKEKVFEGVPRYIRMFNTCLIFIPKKNGKTQLASALALYHLISDGENSPEVYSLAVNESQSRFIWQEAKKMVDANPNFAKFGIDTTDSPALVRNKNNYGFVKPLAGNPEGLQGLKVSATICDELHQYSERNIEMYHSVTSRAASANRTQPVKIIITTAGVDPTGYLKKLVARGLKIQNREEKEHRGFLPAIWMSRGYDERNAIEIAKKVNPSYKSGLVDDELFVEQLEEAKIDENKENEFKAYHLNMFIKKGSRRWIQLERWNENKTDVNLEPMFQKFPVYLGLDFGMKRAFTSLAVLCKDSEKKKIYFKCHTWITQNEIEEQPTMPFADWQKFGYFEPEVFDYFDPNMLRPLLHNVIKRYPNIRLLGYDKYMIGDEMERFDNEVNFDCVQVQNNYLGINEAASDFYHHIVSNNLRFNKSDLLDWCVENVFVIKNPQGQIMVDKRNTDTHIDPIVAIIMALDCMNKYEKQLIMVPKIRTIRKSLRKKAIFKTNKRRLPLWQSA